MMWINFIPNNFRSKLGCTLHINLLVFNRLHATRWKREVLTLIDVLSYSFWTNLDDPMQFSSTNVSIANFGMFQYWNVVEGELRPWFSDHGEGKSIQKKVILEHSRRWTFKIFFNHGEGGGIKTKAILEYSRRWTFKIFFSHGEGRDIQKKAILEYSRGWIFKFSSTMVKVEASKRNQFYSILEGEFSKFSSTMVKVETSKRKQF